MTATTLVYRVELDNGRGPYVDEYEDGQDVNSLRYELREAHGWDNGHPGPFMDGLNSPGGMIFGFSNRHQLRTWFAGWADDLAETGFRVSVYRVHRNLVRHGGHQAIFERYAATKLRSLDPRKLLDTVAPSV